MSEVGATPVGVAEPARRKADPRLLQLVYVSSATQVLAPAELDAIARASQRNNDARGLTGLLLCRGSYFYGVLEGFERRTLTCMERIVADHRHRGIRILREETVSSRRFRNWTFAALPPPAFRLSPAEAEDDFIRTLSQRLG